MSEILSAPSRLGAVHARLARRLTLSALGGFCLLGGALLAALGGALWAVWRAVQIGLAPEFAVWMVVALACLLVARRLLALIVIPAPGPYGIPLGREEASALHYRIDEVVRRMGVPRLDGVWVTDEMNASVLQRPRLGCLGGVETHLMIGLPLTHCLTRRQFLAVLAHEFGHLVAQRRGLGACGAHLRSWWLRVAERTVELYPRLEAWVDRRSRAYTLEMLRLARLEEFEADAVAASVVGRRLLGEALIEVSAKDRFLREDYWPKVLAQCESAPEPRIRPFREMGLGVAAGFHAGGRVHGGFCGDGGAGSLHPSPAERLRALRVLPGAEVRPGPSAANHYLAELLPHLAWAFDRHWWSCAGRTWRRAYRMARRDQIDD
ncbi:hypothetical protein E6C76_15625 [Pseudothauera nasutitermitis]|uniref:Peptidase M48 domain-containing protein n=1 Tax=Pseudothauera nasutitermitis TaxID=2565930 RepID=A0A4S4AVW5_9RHOO|nr:M48 family metallopeptidase [Pseudothauera nasutitermitis]THF63994.1 hypothetical protein E6C76_15625 [Pseudothauera nasutitermitis]